MVKDSKVITLYEALKEMRCARDLSDSSVQALADVSIRKKLSSGQCLWKMGDPGEFVAVILSGAFEIDRLSSAGTETCLGIFGPGDVIGMSAVLKKINYPGTAKAFSQQAEILKMYLRPVIQNRIQPVAGEISEWLRERLLEHEQILRDKLDVLSAGRVEQKVLELLEQLNRRFGLKQSRHSSMIPLKISKTQLGRLAEVRVETMIRLLGRWKKKNLVSFEREGIHILDWQELQKTISRGPP